MQAVPTPLRPSGLRAAVRRQPREPPRRSRRRAATPLASGVQNGPLGGVQNEPSGFKMVPGVAARTGPIIAPPPTPPPCGPHPEELQGMPGPRPRPPRTDSNPGNGFRKSPGAPRAPHPFVLRKRKTASDKNAKRPRPFVQPPGTSQPASCENAKRAPDPDARVRAMRPAGEPGGTPWIRSRPLRKRRSAAATSSSARQSSLVTRARSSTARSSAATGAGTRARPCRGGLTESLEAQGR